MDQKNYTSALQYAEYVLQLDSENEDALVLEGQIYVLMKQDAKAETVLQSTASVRYALTAAERDPLRLKGYGCLQQTR